LLSFSVFLVIALFFYLSRKSVAMLVPRLKINFVITTSRALRVVKSWMQSIRIIKSSSPKKKDHLDTCYCIKLYRGKKYFQEEKRDAKKKTNRYRPRAP